MKTNNRTSTSHPPVKLNNAEDYKPKIILALILIALVVISRVVMPYPANFAPIAAVAIFSGAILPRNWALTLPLLAMIISDFFIGMHSLVFFTWGSFMLIALLANRYMKKINPLTVVGASLGASVLFFVVSNFGVWVEGRLYPLTMSGLIQSYYYALPFFRNTLLGDMTFTVSIFSLYAVAYKLAFMRTKAIKPRQIDV